MASGYYPLRSTEEGGKQIAEIADTLKKLLDDRSPYSRGGLPCAYENAEGDNAASDGHYEAYLYLSLELLERCIKRDQP